MAFLLSRLKVNDAGFELVVTAIVAHIEGTPVIKEYSPVGPLSATPT